MTRNRTRHHDEPGIIEEYTVLTAIFGVINAIIAGLLGLTD